MNKYMDARILGCVGVYVCVCMGMYAVSGCKCGIVYVCTNVGICVYACVLCST